MQILSEPMQRRRSAAECPYSRQNCGYLRSAPRGRRWERRPGPRSGPSKPRRRVMFTSYDALSMLNKWKGRHRAAFWRPLGFPNCARARAAWRRSATSFSSSNGDAKNFAEPLLQTSRTRPHTRKWPHGSRLRIAGGRNRSGAHGSSSRGTAKSAGTEPPRHQRNRQPATHQMVKSCGAT